jgi:energy-converting hydrogenase Eha subunit A
VNAFILSHIEKLTAAARFITSILPMTQRRFLAKALAVICGLFICFTSPAYAYDNPDLLPKEQTPIIDLAKALTPFQEERLSKDITEFEQDTGWKLRVLTQFDRTPGRAVKEYWGLDDKSVLLVADSRGGNILNFNVGDLAYKMMPRTFWIELQTRFGNLYYVREHGEDGSILDAMDTVKTCLAKGGCTVVPGLPQEQWLLTLVTSVVGGLVCGFAGQSRKEGSSFSWQWALIFSPLWGILFIAFGIAPVLTRTEEWQPLVRNIAGFMIGALVAYLSPVLANSEPSENES